MTVYNCLYMLYELVLLSNLCKPVPSTKPFLCLVACQDELETHILTKSFSVNVAVFCVPFVSVFEEKRDNM